MSLLKITVNTTMLTNCTFRTTGTLFNAVDQAMEKNLHMHCDSGMVWPIQNDCILMYLLLPAYIIITEAL